MSKIVDYRIVISENASTCERRAASFLRTNIKLVCGKTLEIVKDSEKPSALEIVVGKTNREALDGVELEFDDGAAEAIAELALERKTGARGLRSIFENAMMQLMYELPSRDDVQKVIITGEYIKGKSDPIIITK